MFVFVPAHLSITPGTQACIQFMCHPPAPKDNIFLHTFCMIILYSISLLHSIPWRKSIWCRETVLVLDTVISERLRVPQTESTISTIWIHFPHLFIWYKFSLQARPPILHDHLSSLGYILIIGAAQRAIFNKPTNRCKIRASFSLTHLFARAKDEENATVEPTYS